MFVVRSVLSVLLVMVFLFSHLARAANNKYDNGSRVKTRINIREPDNRARSHAGPQEYVTRHAGRHSSKQNNNLPGPSPLTRS